MANLQPAAPVEAPAFEKLDQSVPAFKQMRSIQMELLSKLEQCQLRPVPTKLAKDGTYVINSSDGDFAVVTQVGEGQRVRWFVSTATALVKSQIGTVRINVLPDTSTRVPKLDIEIFYFFNTIALYANLAARKSLMLDKGYLRRYYTTPTASGRSPHDLYLSATADKTLAPFQTKSMDMRVLAGQTALFLQTPCSHESVEKLGDYARQMVDMWLEFMADEGGRVSDPSEIAELEAIDKVLYDYPRRDPDNGKAVALMGEEAVEQLLKLATRDPAILL